MAGMFTGINTALRGLEAQQTAIDVTSHNIANVSTPGYSRQQAIIETTPPINDPSLLPAGAGQLGTGATVGTIQRAHDDFVQQQQLYQNSVLQQNTSDSNILSNVSSIFNDPGPQGFSTLLSSYFSAWQSLASNPADAPTRATVISSAQALAAGFNTASTSLHELQINANNQISPLVSQINTITAQLAQINGQINEVTGLNQQPNDLLDQRDNLLNQLSQIVDVDVYIQPNGTANVLLHGGGAIVQGTSQFALTTTPDPNHPGFTAVAMGSAPTSPVTVSGGQLGGAFNARDNLIQQRITALDSLANNVMQATNYYQTQGYDLNGNQGIPFFQDTSGSTTSTTAGSIEVNPALVSDPTKIAASASATEPGDGAQARLISDLQSNPAPVPAGQTTTIQAQYASMITALGVDAQTAQSNLKTNTLVMQNLTAQQASVSGVSLNEEASNLVEYQNAYEACTRVIAIIQQSISDMIQQLGG